MDIVFVASLYCDWGKPNQGFPYYLYKVTHALKQMNHNPMILTVGKGNFYREDDGIPIWTVSDDGPNKGNDVQQVVSKYIYISYVVNKKLREILETVHVDIVQFTSLLGLAVCYCEKLPAVLRLSSYHKMCFSDESTFPKKTVDAIAFMERLSAKNCDAIFAPADVTANYFKNDTGRYVDVIETPFIYDETILDESFFEQHLTDKKYVLFFGTMYSVKGIKVIANILEKFLNQYKNFYFVFIGDAVPIDGESATRLLQRSAGRCSNRIMIFDAIPHKQLYPVIKQAEFVVMPSLMDNLPNACIEAMYLKQVVIGTNGASFEQLIEDGKSGFLCTINDADDLYNTMCRASGLSRSQRKEIGENARIRIDKLKPEFVVTKLVEYYRKTINHHTYPTRFWGLIVCMLAKTIEQYDNLFYKVARLQKACDKSTGMWLIFQRWHELSRNRKEISDYLFKNGYTNIAIYGMGFLGKTLLNELQKTNITVRYAIDVNANSIVASVAVLSWDVDWPQVDAIIVSPVNIYCKIKFDIEKKISCDVLSLEHIIYSM